MEELIKEYGFASAEEYHYLVSHVDLSSPEKIKAFEGWKMNDGSKEGLVSLGILSEMKDSE